MAQVVEAKEPPTPKRQPGRPKGSWSGRYHADGDYTFYSLDLAFPVSLIPLENVPHFSNAKAAKRWLQRHPELRTGPDPIIVARVAAEVTLQAFPRPDLNPVNRWRCKDRRAFERLHGQGFIRELDHVAADPEMKVLVAPKLRPAAAGEFVPQTPVPRRSRNQIRERREKLWSKLQELAIEVQVERKVAETTAAQATAAISPEERCRLETIAQRASERAAELEAQELDLSRRFIGEVPDEVRDAALRAVVRESQEAGRSRTADQRQ